MMSEEAWLWPDPGAFHLGKNASQLNAKQISRTQATTGLEVGSTDLGVSFVVFVQNDRLVKGIGFGQAVVGITAI